MQELLTGNVEVLGRITGSSNATFLVQVGTSRAIYKPAAGEKPLWDFPDGTLAARERATWLIADGLEWNVVPPTVLRDGPYGPGSFQSWVEVDETEPAVDLVPQGATPVGWISVLSGADADGVPVDVVHRDVTDLRRIALVDVVVNNSDRKGGHVLSVGGDCEVNILGIDHGLTFHTDPKLRTVLWGWIGAPLRPEEIAALEGLSDLLAAPDSSSVASPLLCELETLLTADEIAATRVRLGELLTRGVFPEPNPGWPSVPWPAF